MRRRRDALITAAVKQSGREFRPEVTEARSLEEALALLPPPRFFADLYEGAVPFSEALHAIPKGSSLSLLIGPESGWSDNERKTLRAEAVPVLLHPHVLRAETAAVVAAYTAFVRNCENFYDT